MSFKNPDKLKKKKPVIRTGKLKPKTAAESAAGKKPETKNKKSDR